MSNRRISSSSFEIIASPRRSSSSSYDKISDDLSSDEDQIVWNAAASTSSPPPSLSDDDFILLSPPHSSPDGNEHTDSIERSSTPKRTSSPTPSKQATPPQSPLAGKPRSRRHRNRASAAVQSPPISQPTTPSKKKTAKQRRLTAANQSPRGFGARPFVEDGSEKGDDPSVINATLYASAVRYINCFLSEPMENKAAHLALLQALIIELGFFRPASSSLSTQQDTCAPSEDKTPSTPTQTRPSSPPSLASFNLADLPHSMREAKSFIKANVFLNVREYIAVRAQGQQALQSVLHPSRRALITHLRKKSARVPRNWVKEHGLNVFLVSCH